MGMAAFWYRGILTPEPLLSSAPAKSTHPYTPSQLGFTLETRGHINSENSSGFRKGLFTIRPVQRKHNNERPPLK